MDDLRAYTRWNEGWYPKGGRTALQSLSLLYPEYVKTPAHLAGISGDRDVVVQRLLSGGGLDESACSWVYVPGFRDDDEPVVAIIWEKQPGIRFNGKRGSGRAVGFSDGSHAQVSLGAWAKFLEEQEKLRESALKNRSRGQSK